MELNRHERGDEHRFAFIQHLGLGIGHMGEGVILATGRQSARSWVNGARFWADARRMVRSFES